MAAVESRTSAQDTEDHDLVAAVRGGDDRAFEVLYERYHRQIGGYVRGMVRDHGRAEDITQEVFMSALRRIRETDREIVFKPWIYEIAKNACIDAFRRSRRTDEVSYDAEDGAGAAGETWLVAATPSPDAAIETKQAMENLRGAFGGLSQTHHDILVMRELEGRSYREIGERLGMSHASVESTLFRARKRLSEEYDELISGERCVQVQSIIVSAAGRALGTRDQRRMARHISHCQPCRRHAHLAGVDLETGRRSVAARIAAFLPLPAFLRRGRGGDSVLASHNSSTVAQWSANVAGAVDPATMANWSKAAVAAATVAVAGLGAGAAITHRTEIKSLLSPPPAVKHVSPAGGGLPGGTSGAVDRRSTSITVSGLPFGNTQTVFSGTGGSTLNTDPATGGSDHSNGSAPGHAPAGGGTGGLPAGGSTPAGGGLGGHSIGAAPATPPTTTIGSSSTGAPSLGNVTQGLANGLHPTTTHPAGGTTHTGPLGARRTKRKTPIRNVLSKTLGGGSTTEPAATAPAGTVTGAVDNVVGAITGAVGSAPAGTTGTAAGGAVTAAVTGVVNGVTAGVAGATLTSQPATTTGTATNTGPQTIDQAVGTVVTNLTTTVQQVVGALGTVLKGA